MSLSIVSSPDSIIYPESDGQPMADNTIQYRWIELLKGNLEIHFASDPNVFVAGDLLWYPVKNHPEIRTAPDVLVAFGRPKGDRGSYRQWEEGDIAPQVVFEVLSPGNRAGEMAQKSLVYDRYGVQEYYIYDPSRFEFDVLIPQNGTLTPQRIDNEWVSPLLGIRFVLHQDREMEVYYPDGRPFVSMMELDRLRQQERARAEAERQRAEVERERAEVERQRADVAEEKAARLAEKLRALGIDSAD